MDFMVVFNNKNNYMFRPIAAIFKLLQFFSKSIIYMPILRVDAEISSSLCRTRNDDEIAASPRSIDIYMILFEKNCNNLKMAVIGRNM